MKIGIDIDGVVADFVGTFIPLAEERYGVVLNEEDIYVHDLYLVLGIKEEDALYLIRQTITSNPKPYAGAVEALRALKEKHEVVLMTARPEDLMEVTESWLAHWDVPYDRLAHFSEGFKYENEDGLDVVVDDHLREAFGFVDKVRHIVIFDRPWNRTLNAGKLFERTYDWQHLLALIAAFESH